MLQSNLVGMQIDLPAPLAKPVAPTALPLRLQLTPLADAEHALRDSLQFELGDLLKAQFQRDLSGPEPRVLRGSVAVLDTLPPLPAVGRAGRAEPRPRRPRRLAGAGRPQRHAGANPAAGGYLPQTLQLRADELRSGTRSCRGWRPRCPARARRPNRGGRPA